MLLQEDEKEEGQTIPETIVVKTLVILMMIKKEVIQEEQEVKEENNQKDNKDNLKDPEELVKMITMNNLFLKKNNLLENLEEVKERKGKIAEFIKKLKVQVQLKVVQDQDQNPLKDLKEEEEKIKERKEKVKCLHLLHLLQRESKIEIEEQLKVPEGVEATTKDAQEGTKTKDLNPEDNKDKDLVVEETQTKEIKETKETKETKENKMINKIMKVAIQNGFLLEIITDKENDSSFFFLLFDFYQNFNYNLNHVCF